MRQYSDSERSSAAASFARSVQSLGGTRSFSSSVHFSLMQELPEKESLHRACPNTMEAESRATTETTSRGGGSTVIDAWSSCCAAQVGPVNILAELFTPYSTGRLALDGYRQTLAAATTIRHVAQVPESRSAPCGNGLAVDRLQGKPVSLDIHTRMIFTIWCCRQHLAPSVRWCRILLQRRSSSRLSF